MCWWCASPCRGAILVDAIVRARSFVTVSVVDRDEEQDDVVQYSGDGLRDGDVAKERKSCVFAVGFTGVNAGLNQNDSFAFRFCGFGREGACF
jgi:hypothetical protein